MSGPTPVPVTRALRELGEDLATWRKLQRLTAQQVASRADISRSTLRRVEHGDGGVSAENLLRVARALGLLQQLANACDPYQSDVGRLRMDEVLPQRVRQPRAPRT